jgi:hypothetical protein
MRRWPWARGNDDSPPPRALSPDRADALGERLSIGALLAVLWILAGLGALALLIGRPGGLW